MKEYTTRTKIVQAREIAEQSEMVDCYTGICVGTMGDYVVTDEYGKTMIMKKDKFNQRYEERKHGDDFNASKWIQGGTGSSEQATSRGTTVTTESR